jgi:spore coat protein U-like protein
MSSRRARNAALLLATCVLAGAGGHAAAGVTVGGVVPSVLGLALPAQPPASRLSHFSSSSSTTQTLTIASALTTTEVPTQLSLADATNPTGAARGHLLSGAHTLPQPLFARAGSGAWASLAAAVPATLLSLEMPLASAPQAIELRQTVTRGSHVAPGVYDKTVLITLSADAP